MNTNMNILIISRGIPSKQDPQWGNFEFEQGKALSKLGHNVIIASIDSRFRLYKRKIGLTIEKKDGITCYNYYLCPDVVTNILGARCTYQIKKWQWHKIETLLFQNEEHIDIIYSHYLINSYYAVHFLQNINAPIVAMEHWSELNQPVLKPAIRKMGEATYPYVKKLLTVSNATRLSIIKHFSIDSLVVHNMIDFETFKLKAIDKKINTSKCKLSLIAVGNLLPIKGYDILISALAQVNIPKDKWNLRIVGHGKGKKQIKALIAHYDLLQNIELVGQKNKTEIQELLSKSDVFILASRSETFGVAYIEAMACGLPVIATRCGGPEEFVTKNNGLLVPVEDVTALKNAIEYMSEHYQEYNQQTIANDCKNLFSSDVIAKKLIEIFDEIVT